MIWVFIGGFVVGFIVAAEIGRHIYNSRMADFRKRLSKFEKLLKSKGLL